MKIHPDILIFGALLFLWFWPELLAAYGYRLPSEKDDHLVPKYLVEQGFLGKELKVIQLKPKSRLLNIIGGLLLFIYPVLVLTAALIIRDHYPDQDWVMNILLLPVYILIAPYIRFNLMRLAGLIGAILK